MKRTLAALLTALMLLTFLPLASPSAQAASINFGVYSTTSATSLRITWSSVPGAVFYVYRSTDLKNWYPILTTYSTSFTDTYLRAGTRYFYKLEFETPDGLRYYTQGWRAGVPMGTTRITSLISPARGRVRMVWSRTAGAGGYIVQMATSPYGNYKTVRITPGTTTTFSGVRRGLTLYFKVIPYKRIYGTTYMGRNADIWRISLPR